MCIRPGMASNQKAAYIPRGKSNRCKVLNCYKRQIRKEKPCLGHSLDTGPGLREQEYKGSRTSSFAKHVKLSDIRGQTEFDGQAIYSHTSTKLTLQILCPGKYSLRPTLLFGWAIYSYILTKLILQNT